MLKQQLLRWHLLHLPNASIQHQMFPTEQTPRTPQRDRSSDNQASGEPTEQSAQPAQPKAGDQQQRQQDWHASKGVQLSKQLDLRKEAAAQERQKKKDQCIAALRATPAVTDEATPASGTTAPGTYASAATPDAEEAPAGSFLLALLQAARQRPAVGSQAYHPYAGPAASNTNSPKKPTGGKRGKGKGQGAPPQAEPQKAAKEATQHSPLRYIKEVTCSPTRNAAQVSPGNTPTQRTGARRSDRALPGKAAPNGDPPVGAPVVPIIEDDDNSDDNAKLSSTLSSKHSSWNKAP